MSDLPTYSAATVATHNSFTDCWVSHKGKVYDITRFIYEHPGGDSVLIQFAAGQDVEELMAGRDGGPHDHSEAAYAELDRYVVGTLEAEADTELDVQLMKSTLRDLQTTASDLFAEASKLSTFGEQGAQLRETSESAKTLFRQAVTESHKEALAVLNSHPEALKSSSQKMRTRLASVRNALLRFTGQVSVWGESITVDKESLITTRRYHMRKLASSSGGSGLETALYAAIAATIAGIAGVVAGVSPLAGAVPPNGVAGMSVPVAGSILVAVEFVSLGGVLSSKSKLAKERTARENEIASIQSEITSASSIRGALEAETQSALAKVAVLQKVWASVGRDAATPENVGVYMREYVASV
ncbi:hypothetical protein FB45DRAFT_944542 [Roridomyces roridus]|uniref:Cytochrome b5 heme-binding domain-containing protein n=1 Tax=Roridomyces roridus TaxID=1738132 RepID=A0AAD7F8U9_9AGAR|nr:hypothetical protein FB45DRAFT_944542 [Roridomyces roridus]